MDMNGNGAFHGLERIALQIGRRVAAGELDSGEAARLVSAAVARSNAPKQESQRAALDWMSIGMEDFHPRDGVPYVARCLANVRPVPIAWLWQQRLAIGKLNLLAGQPGLGKSQISTWMAATVSRGGAWPDRSRAPRGSVVFVSCEDDAGDTIVPRLEAAGADLNRIHLLDWVRDGHDGCDPVVRSYDLSRDVAALGALCADIGDVRLVVIDPVSAYMGGADSHKVSDVRGTLAPLQTLASEQSYCVVMITHLNKGTDDGSAMSRVAGSGAYVAACRSAWFVAPHPQDERRRILTPLKNNIGDDRTGFSYTIEGATVSDGISTSRVVFSSEPVTISADDALAAARTTGDEDSALSEAVDFLREFLADGPKGAKAAAAAARESGVSERTLRRARERLGIKPRKQQSSGAWQWSMPTCDDGQGGQGGHESANENGGHHE